eukprot:5580683-Prymnesium_polylepis.1
MRLRARSERRVEGGDAAEKGKKFSCCEEFIGNDRAVKVVPARHVGRRPAVQNPHACVPA